MENELKKFAAFSIVFWCYQITNYFIPKYWYKMLLVFFIMIGASKNVTNHKRY